MTKRQSLSPMKRLAVFEAAKSMCHLCGLRIKAGERWEVEHVRAIGLLGKDDASNMAPAHVHCHATKTIDDVGRIAKAKRQRARHVGAKQPTSFRKPAGMKFDWRRRCYIRETSNG